LGAAGKPTRPMNSASRSSLRMLRLWPALIVIVVANSRAFPAEPDARANPFVLGGEASGAIAPVDEGFFNYTDYKRGSLRIARLSLSASWRLGGHVMFLGEVRSENLDTPRPYALYVRLRPWLDRSVDVQVGMIPPVFGAFARHPYGLDNPLIGYPLAYQYLTTVRPDAVPLTANDLLRARGSGWRAPYPFESSMAEPGLPLVNADRWDTGVEVRLGSAPVAFSAALTQGALSNPTFRGGDGGKQVSARLAFQPSPSFVLGASGARGEYLNRAVKESLPDSVAHQLYPQSALGMDVEYSRNYWIVRAEMVWSSWDMPVVGEPRITSPLKALGVFAEARYKIVPGFYVAARADHLGFNEIRGSLGPQTWDAPVSRLEGGVGYFPLRNILLKGVYQYNWRDGGRVRTQGIAAAQLLLWF